MLNERDRRALDDMERRILADDPGFAGRMSGRRSAPRGRAALRRATSPPLVLVLLAAAVAAFLAQVSAVGWLLVCLAVAGGTVWLARAARSSDTGLEGWPPSPTSGAASTDGSPERD